MSRCLLFLAIALCAQSASAASPSRTVRVSGAIQAVRSVIVQVPRIEGQGGNLTLTKMVANGVTVHQGDLLAEFDRTSELKAAREAESKYDDLVHQVEQKQAEDKSNREKRVSDLQQAEADLKKAQIELHKAPILSDIDKEKHEVEVQDATEHVASLHRSNAFHDQAEAAELRILELQRDRQKLAVERAQSNANKLSLRAPISGMVALQNVYRNNSLGHAEEGDELWPGSPLMQIFDPSKMAVVLSVDEPDGPLLVPGSKAVLHLDAFPQLTFTAHFDSASPVASAVLGSPVKTFSAIFLLDQSDPHLLPDLSAAVDIQIAKMSPGTTQRASK